MAYYNTLSEFYKSKDFYDVKVTLKAERTAADGFLYCEYCHKPMTARDIIAHHIEPLTLDNVNDCNITLNPENIQLVHFRCHNAIHDRFGAYTKHIYLVYGCPLAGKKTFVQERAGVHDLIIDLDRIYACISNNPMYVKSGRIADNVFAVRDLLLEQIKYKRGKWVNAFLIGGYPFKGERERIAAELGAEEVFIECDKETALMRLASCEDGRDKKAFEDYINQWFSRYSA